MGCPCRHTHMLVELDWLPWKKSEFAKTAAVVLNFRSVSDAECVSSCRKGIRHASRFGKRNESDKGFFVGKLEAVIEVWFSCCLNNFVLFHIFKVQQNQLQLVQMWQANFFVSSRNFLETKMHSRLFFPALPVKSSRSARNGKWFYGQ